MSDDRATFYSLIVAPLYLMISQLGAGAFALLLIVGGLAGIWYIVRDTIRTGRMAGAPRPEGWP